MSTASESHYFPSLDKCLSGGQRLISWKVAYQALLDDTAAANNGHLEKFLNNNESINILTSVLDLPQRPSPQDERDLETKTAPINVSQANTGEYNLAELKADASWLAKEFQIQELVALRIAIVELQERPSDQLFRSLSKELPLLQGITQTAPGSAISDNDTNSSLDFSQLDLRRQRLLRVHLSEREHLLKICVDLLGRHLVSQSDRDGHVLASRGSARNWIDDLAAKITLQLFSGQQGPNNDGLCRKCIASLQNTLSKLENSDQWPHAYRTTGPSEVTYINFQYVEMISTLRLLLASVYSLNGIPSTSTVQAWFTLLGNYGFLLDIQRRFAALANTAPQCLVSIISVGILKTPLVLAKLANMDERAKISGELYLKNEECAHFLNNIMYECARQGVESAAPAVFAWGLMISQVHEIAVKHRAKREALIESSTGEADDPSHATRRDAEEQTSDFETLSDFFFSQDMDEAKENPPRYFQEIAVDRMRVLPFVAALSAEIDGLYGSFAESATALMSKEALLDFLRTIVEQVVYGGELLEAVLSTINPGVATVASRQHARILGNRFMSDDTLRSNILGNAAARYPYELSPLLRLCKVLANAYSARGQPEGSLNMVLILDQLECMTQMVSEDFRSYQLDHEDENSNIMVLTDTLPIFTIKPNLLTRNPGLSMKRILMPGSDTSTDETRAMSIPPGTQGVFVKETRPYVLKFDHPHSGLEYLGILLSTFRANSELTSLAPGSGLDRLTAAELISLVSGLLSASLSSRGGVEQGTFVLGRFGYALANEQDIISVIADIFEAELSAHLNQIAEEGSLELLTACTEFLVHLVDIMPERTWSTLARSSLLGINSSVVSLAAVVGNTEAQTGHYRFLTACVQLYDKLLADSIAGLVKRKARGFKTGNRFDSPVESMDAIPERTISTVLNAFQKILLGAIQNIPQWNFEVPQERCEIVSIIGKAFTKLFKTALGITAGKKLSNQFTAVLTPAAEALLELCAPKSGPSAIVNTCSKIIPDNLFILDTSLSTGVRIALVKQTRTLLEFLLVLLRAVKLGHKSDPEAATGNGDSRQRVRNLATNILQMMPTFAGILASDHGLKADVFVLLSELVQAVNLQDTDPPSILSQLNAGTAQSFLKVVTQLDRPLCDIHVERQAWDFLATIMSNKQQWFAIYLLTGTLPKIRVKDSGNTGTTPKSLLTYALTQLSGISVLSPDRAAGMLRFVAHAQQTWVWATNELRSHPDFLKNILSWLENIEAPSRESNPATALIAAREYEMATYVCNILAINVHASLEIGDTSVVKMIVPKLKFLRDYGVVIKTYNRSLHRNLAENLKRKFPNSDLSDFQRTEVNPAPFGTDYYYDRALAAAVLRHNLAWEGADPDRNHGFSGEFARANANLSLYDAQVGLLRSWKSLATTLCECADSDAALQRELAQVAERCLNANLDTQLDEPGVADMLQLRVELAFVLSSRLVGLKAEDESLKDILFAAWELVRASPVDYDISTAAEDVRYYRSILQVLYLAIQPHQYMNAPKKPARATDETAVLYLAPTTASCLVDIVGKVIVPGFRALCSNLHTDVQLALPADFALLTALLQAVLSVPGVSSVHTLMADLVAGSSLVRSALSLFSWADQLAEVMDQDPIYGEIAITFLVALSTVRPIAEQMALQGVLTQLSSANLSNYFRKNTGKGPFDEPQRMFTIWTEGFLPLCLNLLDAVGPPIASDVASFLNSFPQQLKRAEKALQNASPSPHNPRAGAVTLSLVSEAHSLTMIATILSSDVARGAAEGINAADVPPLDYNVEDVKDMVEALCRSKRSLSDRIVAVSPLEERWQTTAAPGVSDNLLMAKIFRELISMQECWGGPDASNTI